MQRVSRATDGFTSPQVVFLCIRRTDMWICVRHGAPILAHWIRHLTLMSSSLATNTCLPGSTRRYCKCQVRTNISRGSQIPFCGCVSSQYDGAVAESANRPATSTATATLVPNAAPMMCRVQNLVHAIINMFRADVYLIKFGMILRDLHWDVDHSV
jgi:hypothetical protein